MNTQATVKAHMPDYWLIGAPILLLGLGLVMVTSASITSAERGLGQPLYYLLRQSVHLAVGLVLAWGVLRMRLVYWEKAGPVLLLLSFLLLTLVLLPGVGKEVNGSRRWLELGGLSVQPSEFVKLFLVVYLAGYLVRRGAEVCGSARGFLKPMALAALLALLLLAEPDFGAAVVLCAVVLGMLYLGGAKLGQFGLLLLFALLILGALTLVSPYRLERLTSFINPWADPFDSGFQLTQALIAFGRGEWLGVGLGASIQKLYLPEAHTDFLFAVLAEELGLAGTLSVIALYGVIVWRAFALAQHAAQRGQIFAMHLAHGVGLWLALQAFINMGVNMGLLPTKGLTLPLMSYGGSSLVMSCIAIALLLRIDHELGLQGAVGARMPGPERVAW